jgi:hypothetical protein
MTPTRLFRWSGIALTGAGLLIALGFLLHPDISQPHAADQALWVPAHGILLLSLLLTLFGTIGLFLRQSEQAGWAGLSGFVLMVVGIALTAIAITVDAFIFPVIEASASGAVLTDPAGPLLSGPLGLMLLGATIAFALGAIVLGVATFRAGVLPRWAALLLAVGGPLLAADPFLPQLVVMLGAVLTSASFIWLGIRLIGQPVHVLVREQPAIAS